VSRKIPTIRLRQLEGQLGEVAYQITKIHFSGFHRPDVVWNPAINVFLCECYFRISVELAGVEPEEVEIAVAPGHLWIRGYRDAPEPPATEGYEPVPEGCAGEQWSVISKRVTRNAKLKRRTLIEPAA
jgi:hypothetical protein